jgi:glycosyltransferase involved in cell wall biosynthesis
MDPDDQVFSHQFDVVTRLSSFFDEVRVVTNSEGCTKAYPNNVSVFSCEWKFNSNFANALSFYKTFRKATSNFYNFSIFSHMTEIQSFLILPYSFLRKIKHYLWYAHSSNSFLLRINHFFLDGIITSTKGSCPIQGNKVHIIGQGIDDQLFDFRDSRNHIKLEKLKTVHVGRLDPSKKIQTIIDSTLNSEWSNYIEQLVFIGAPTPTHQDYLIGMKDLNINLILSGRLSFMGKIPRRSLPEILQNYDLFVHSFNGSLDKSLVEATLLGIPVVTENAEYQRLFGSWTQVHQVAAFNLSQEMSSFMESWRSDPYSVNKEINRRRSIAVEKHSLNQWILALIGILRDKHS